MRTIRLNAYGTHKKAYRTLFLGSLEWYGTRTMRHFFEKCRSDAYRTKDLKLKRVPRNAPIRNINGRIRAYQIICPDYCFFSGTRWNIFCYFCYFCYR